MWTQPLSIDVNDNNSDQFVIWAFGHQARIQLPCFLKLFQLSQIIVKFFYVL